ncbi:MAG: outer membrane protein assembly factor BamA [Bacteroidetes bacterium]|nr:outer membrane protein assembly factor BamA [Bacteroidota bacterium]
MKYLISIFLLFISLSGFSQINTQADIQQEYIIDNIDVSGEVTFPKSSIVSWSGLYVGNVFKWPGDQAASAIKKLWDLGYFEDIQILYTNIDGNRINLLIVVKERPRLVSYTFSGVSKTDKKDLREKINLQKDKPITENLLRNTKNLIIKHYVDKGRANVKVDIQEKADSADASKVTLKIIVNKGEKVKIQDINFHGNTALSDAKLRGAMKETKRYRWWNVFKDGAFSESDYNSELAQIVTKYNAKGFRDARIVADTVKKLNAKRLVIEVYIEEGKKFYFRNITWVGNTKYTTEDLNRLLAIKKGDVYNMENLNSKLTMDPNGQDISSLYLDDGYLFFNIQPKEIKIENDSVDVEMRIYEGKQARINKVTLIGNTKTSDFVVMREIRTKPGQLFRRSDIIRSQRELSQLKYFNAQKMSVNPKPNPADGTVDIEYIVEEQPSDQVELSAGYGAGRLIGTLGLSFNNFSTKRFRDPKAWSPLPSGDGQTLSIRAQSTGSYYQGYNLSFIEPWLGGKKPNSLSFSLAHTRYSTLDGSGSSTGHQFVSTATVGFGKRLKWPDDFFTLQTSLTYQYYDVLNFANLNANGFLNSFNGKVVLSRNSVDQPIYPRSGSNITLTLQVTPPWNYLVKEFTPGVDPAKFNWIEYNKFKIQAEWYNKIFDNLVLYTKVNFGILGRYNTSLAYSPFERFYLGGSGLANFNVDGREIISLRGSKGEYANENITPALGGVAAVKYTMELRYPISLNPSATIFALAFAEGGRAWSEVSRFSPFEARKSAGVGVRIFMPMFGLLGLDLGYGFDAVVPSWQTTFMIGGNFSGW